MQNIPIQNFQFSKIIKKYIKSQHYVLLYKTIVVQNIPVPTQLKASFKAIKKLNTCMCTLGIGLGKNSQNPDHLLSQTTRSYISHRLIFSG